jgi:hypothetical protein
MLIAQSRHPPGPFSFDRAPPFELQAEFAKEIDRASEVLDDDSDIVHPFDCHVSISWVSFHLQGVACSR